MGKPSEARPGEGMIKPALAVFVKTPALSPVKTRLAAGIGAPHAAAFYARSVAALEALFGVACARLGFAAYWAVAEADGLSAWTSAPTVSQGEGNLSERLAAVEAALFATHGEIFFVGADCPQLAPEDLGAARAALASGAQFVIGPSADGGFYLFGAKIPAGRAAWLRVPMSADDTAARLGFELAGRGTVAWLKVKTDADRAEDLPSIRRELAALENPTSAQRELAQWLASL